MKCIKKNEVVQRVNDAAAAKLVKQGWNYISKGEWKKSKAKHR